MGIMSNRRRLTFLSLITILLLSLQLAGVLAQDTPPTAAPAELTETLAPPPEATVEPAAPELTDEPAPEITVEAPPPATAVPTTTPSATPLPAEPPLALLSSDLFEGAAFENWTATGWELVPADAGQSAQTGSTSPLTWTGGPYLNAAAQARFLLPDGGTAAIIVRRSADTLAYAAALDSSGQVTLYRADVPVASATVPALRPDEWRALRLSAINSMVRVSVNGVEVIAWDDAAPLPPGAVALVVVGLPENGRALTDDFGLWVPQAELALYPTATPLPSATPTAALAPTLVPATPTLEITEGAVIVTATLAPEVTDEATAEVTAAPETTEEAAVVTATPAPEVTVEATAEVTAVPEATDEAAESTPEAEVTDEPVGPDGKSLAVNAVDEPVSGLAAAEDLPSGAILIPSIPFSASGTTNRTDLGSAGEPSPTCGFNITRTLWHRFVVPTTGPYVITSAGSAFDTILAAYTDPFSTPAVALGCSDDASPTELTSRLSLNLTAGQTVYIQLGGYNGFSGPYTLRVQQANVPLPWASRQLAPRYAATLWDTDGVADIAFEWTPLSVGTVYEPASYQLQVARTAWFTDLVYDVSGLTSPAATRAFDTPGVYYWRVRGLNVNEQPSAWSAAWLFYVNTAPSAPTLYLPADASVTTLTRPTLIWLPVAGASGYRVDISTDPAFTSFVLENQPAVPNYLLLPAALSQGRYFWRAQAVDAAGNLSGESAAFQLDINIGSLPAPNTTFTTYPTLPTARPTFVWVAQTGAPTYTLEIAANASFSSVLYSVNVPVNYHVLPLANALPDGVYFWRVRVNGETLPPSVFHRFTVSPPPAPAPVQTGPAYGAWTNDSTPDLAWNPVPPTAAGGPFTYELQLDRAASFVSAALLNYTQADGVTETGFTVPAALDDAFWFWRVRAVNAQGRPGLWSPARLLWVDTIAPPAPTLYLPANASVTALTRPTLIWLPVAGASGYRVDISTDPAFTSFMLENQPAVPNYLLLPTALSQGRYFWRAQAVDAAGNLSGESAAFQLDINIGSLPAPNTTFTTYPTLPTARPTFVWVAQTGAPTYTLEIAANASFSSVLYSVNVPVNYHVLPLANALPDGVYFWRVRVNGETLPPTVFSRFTVSPPPAPAPVQTGPAYGAWINDSTPDLAWNPVSPTAAGGPFTYELQLDRAASFVSASLRTFTQADGVTETGFTVPTALDDAFWFWRVRAVNAQGRPGLWSPARLLWVDTIAPPAPTLYLPANASVTALTRPTLIWLPVAGASGYRVDISTDPAFSSFVLENQPAVPNYLLLPSALSQGRYFWRVQAVDAAGNVGPESAAFQLDINIGSLPAPNTTFTTYPTLPTARPTFVWVAQTGAPTYTLEIAANASFSSVLYSVDVAVNYHVLPLANALPDGVYYWRVRVNGETLPPSVFHRFTVSPPPAPAPVQTGPAYGAQLPSSAPAFTWNPVPPTAAGGPFTYELQLDRVSWFGSAALLNYTQVNGVSASGFTIPGPLADGYWFWRVRAVNAQGRAGYWSPAYYFAVDTVAPPAPALYLPANASAAYTQQPVFVWFPAPGAARYEIALSTDPAFTTPLLAASAWNSFVPPAPLLLTTYSWRVRAFDAAGNTSAWSDTRTLKVESPLYAAPILNRYTATPTLTWTPVSWAQAYHVQIAQDAAFTRLLYDNDALAAGTLQATPGTLPNGAYYWRIRARSGAAAWGWWSTPGMFLVDSAS